MILSARRIMCCLFRCDFYELERLPAVASMKRVAHTFKAAATGPLSVECKMVTTTDATDCIATEQAGKSCSHLRNLAAKLHYWMFKDGDSAG
jgi:hypothetical protein